jgi:capsular exopolysaccharide synthesis family protein
MDTIDRSNSNLPARFPTASSLSREFSSGLAQDQTSTSTVQLSPKVILRALARHWWRILAIWLVVTAPAGFLIYMFVQPTYDVVSLLRIEPVQPDLLSPINRGIGEIQNKTYLKTQVGLIMSSKVLTPAIADPLVVNLPMIKNSKDPKTDLVEKLKVYIIDETNLIKVSLELPNAEEAVVIVRAVVESYLAQNMDYSRSANRELTESLKQQLVKIGEEINLKRDKLKELYKKGNVAVNPGERLNNVANDGNVTQPTFKNVSENQVQQMMSEIGQTDLQLIEATSTLDVKREAFKGKPEDRPGVAQSSEGELLGRIQEEFKKDPDVLALKQEIDDTLDHLDHLKRTVRQPHDAARVAAQNKLNDLQKDYAGLWISKYQEILSRLTGTGPVDSTQSLAAILELEQKVEMLKQKKAKLAEHFKVMQVEQKATNDDTFEASYLNYQVQSLLVWEQIVKKNLEQLKFEASQDKYRVVLVDPAAAPRSPSNNKRLKFLAAAPVAVMFMMLGLFLLLEIKAERVADPDALSTRVRSEVFALPPLPTARSIRKLSASDADDQIEQFIQRLDHLRFAVCGNPGDHGKGRCVLITSAVGGEGKTTLAAQLAARCGNAGISTLLIDSDFRRAALCPLLDVPEGPGLSDILKDEATLDDVAIPVQGGTFYLLPAGTPIQDTSRLLQSPRFGQLVGQLRQLYDLIIIDSPPVLPVPDALILGRWADGAVIAARYDISRFPQVERARRQLDNAGITILGTVINGMRHSDSYYGRYTYSRQRTNQPESSNTI